jgi:hypothetical protein
MHVLQNVAIKANSKDEAADIVKSKFDSMYSENEGLGGWSDWYVVGGGRWNSNASNQYDHSSNDVISYVDSMEQFNLTVDNALRYRREEVERMKEHADLDKFSNVVNKFISNEFSDEDRFDMNTWYIKKIASIINGEWNSDSYFYDLENYSTSPQYMKDELDKGSKKWYLVPVDFHF